MDINGKSDPYMKFVNGHTKAKQGVLARSTTIYECLNPIFEEAFVFPIVKDVGHIKDYVNEDGKMRFKMEMMDYDLIGKDDDLGYINFTFDSINNSLLINDKVHIYLRRGEIVEEALGLTVPLEGEPGAENIGT
eukprot:Awhi_evm1s155